MGTLEPLIDTFGRVVRDLRISLTDRCNFRCTYCMPAEGLPWLPSGEILMAEEISRLARLFVSLGVRSFKLTGGEPTVRRDLADIVGRLRDIDTGLDISLTTNGLLLESLAQRLRDAGLDRITVSCDSLLRHRFAELTRRDALDKVMRGVAAAERAGFSPVKLNCVVIAGTNDDEILDFVAMARDSGHEVRFIEYMPLDAEQQWQRDRVVASRDLRETIDGAFPLVPDDDDGPATRLRFADESPGAVAFISSVTEPFCDSCDRARITADGNLRACLFALEETDLRTPMRDGASDASLERLVRDAIWSKWAGHKINAADFVRPSRTMSQIGG